MGHAGCTNTEENVVALGFRGKTVSGIRIADQELRGGRGGGGPVSGACRGGVGFKRCFFVLSYSSSTSPSLHSSSLSLLFYYPSIPTATIVVEISPGETVTRKIALLVV